MIWTLLENRFQTPGRPSRYHRALVRETIGWGRGGGPIMFSDGNDAASLRHDHFTDLGWPIRESTNITSRETTPPLGVSRLFLFLQLCFLLHTRLCLRLRHLHLRLLSVLTSFSRLYYLHPVSFHVLVSVPILSPLLFSFPVCPFRSPSICFHQPPFPPAPSVSICRLRAFCLRFHLISAHLRRCLGIRHRRLRLRQPVPVIAAPVSAPIS